MIQNSASIAARPPDSAYFQKDRDIIEKRSGRWLKELARQNQTTGFNLNAWIPAWGQVAVLARFREGIEERSLPLASSPAFVRDSLMSSATVMSNIFFERPILNSPYRVPHSALGPRRDGEPTLQIIQKAQQEKPVTSRTEPSPKHIQ